MELEKGIVCEKYLHFIIMDEMRQSGQDLVFYFVMGDGAKEMEESKFLAGAAETSPDEGR